MIFLKLILAAFLAFANPTHTTTNSDVTTITANNAVEPGDDGTGGGGTGTGTGGSNGTGGNTGQNPPPKP